MHTFSRRRLSAVVGAAAGAAAVGASAAPAAADPGREGGPAADGHRPDTEGRPLSVRDELLRPMKVPSTLTTADGPVWSPVATGFASVASEALPQGAVGGLGGRFVVVRDGAGLAEALERSGPTVVLGEGTIELELGQMLVVSAETSVRGVGWGGEMVGGGRRLLVVGQVVV